MVAALVLIALGSISIEAHPRRVAALVELNRLIDQRPTDGELYLRRGSWLHRSGRYEEALADYARARRLAPDLAEVDLASASLLQDAGLVQEAIRQLESFLLHSPDHPIALLDLARAQAASGDPAAAASSFDRLLATIPTPSTELYYEQGRALRQSGRLADAILALDRGIQRLGSMSVLHRAALEIEIELDLREAALRRFDRVAASSPRAEWWLSWRGEMLRKWGRTGEAPGSLDY